MTNYLENIEETIKDGYLAYEKLVKIEAKEVQKEAYINNRIEYIKLNCELEVKQKVKRVLRRQLKKNEYSYFNRLIIRLLLKKLWKNKEVNYYSK